MATRWGEEESRTEPALMGEPEEELGWIRDMSLIT